MCVHPHTEQFPRLLCVSKFTHYLVLPKCRFTVVRKHASNWTDQLSTECRTGLKD
jgi:hypothetical protein